MKKAVFLDRDGVLNRSILVDGLPKPPSSISDIQILEGAIEAIQILKDHNFIPVVVTNQPDVARGFITQSNVEAINTFIGNALEIVHFYTCFHDDSDLCGCRKPAPGLITCAAQELKLDTSRSYLVGDRWRDISAGQAAGLRTFLIDYPYPEKQPQMPFIRVKSLLEATRIITERSKNERN
jgi:D-glycero-D-manno-heptose 1,7-bisphosphate phosphatase